MVQANKIIHLTQEKCKKLLAILKQHILLISIIAISVAALLYRSHSLKEKTAIPVSIATTKIDTVPIYIEALGTVTPLDNVNVQAQLSGQLSKIMVQDGQIVKKGQQIAQIDPRAYEAQLKQSEGQLLRDQALLENAQLDLKRYQNLWEQNAVSKQILDTQIALVKQYEGITMLDKSVILNAKINLDYCNITSPINGTIGIIAITEGNLVSNSSSIAIINSLNPIGVIFSVPQTNLQQLLSAKIDDLVAEAYDSNYEKLLATGKVIALDNQIDTSTGTVKVKAKFNDSKLFPNQFVNIRLLVKRLENVMLVPVSAVQFGPNGTFVYLLSDDKKTVKAKAVSTGINSNEMIVINDGILAGQSVVTSGTDKLTDGAIVFIPKAEHKK